MILLFMLVLLWIIAATFQDVRTTEISDWLSFSLIGVVLLYRAAYATISHDARFFWFGLLGMAFFAGVAYILYYSKAFAGGDAKLLIGLGGVLPASSYSSLLIYGLLLVGLIFAAGVVWSLVYTVYRVARRPRGFGRLFVREVKHLKKLLICFALLAVVAFIVLALANVLIGLAFVAVFVFLGLLMVYVRVFEKHYLIRKKQPKELMEGDWLVQSVRFGNKHIEATVHGLSLKEIELLKKHRMSVVIREGIPFTPGFLFGFLLFVLTYSRVLTLF